MRVSSIPTVTKALAAVTNSSTGTFWALKKEVYLCKHSPVLAFRCLAVRLPKGSTTAGILPGCPSLDRGSREAEVGFEPRTFRSVNSRSNHLVHLAPSSHVFEKYTHLQINLVFTGDSIESLVYDVLQLNVLHTGRLMIQLTRLGKLLRTLAYPCYLSALPTDENQQASWLKWLEREFADRKVRGSNPTSASRVPLSRLGQPDSIPALVWHSS
ncbi:hypothetical protein T265_06944 [Opisthorchis viverrini]|uniref:Uncharacterized protein n=1 Tax=Opisthorchis viverrini TaxID=6198 RepID=A0A075ACW2_OPIVI|nr:hypothetical protein T265_06944 [Opisthorchis viverrini]KER25654.1 hypothetical protein T265_06944 [Opisthorchis viverrini]